MIHPIRSSRILAASVALVLASACVTTTTGSTRAVPTGPWLEPSPAAHAPAPRRLASGPHAHLRPARRPRDHARAVRPGPLRGDPREVRVRPQGRSAGSRTGDPALERLVGHAPQGPAAHAAESGAAEL